MNMNELPVILDCDPSLDEIIEAICLVHPHVTKKEIVSKDRSETVAWARFSVCYIARETTGLTLNAIGEGLGGRDHGAVLHGINNMKARMEQHPEYAKRVGTWVDYFKQPFRDGDHVVERIPAGKPEIAQVNAATAEAKGAV